MTVHQHRLSISITDYSDAGTSLKFRQFIFKFSTKIIAFQTVNRTEELTLITECCHTSPTSTEMRLIVCTIEKVGNAPLVLVDCAEKATHFYLVFKFLKTVLGCLVWVIGRIF